MKKNLIILTLLLSACSFTNKSLKQPYQISQYSQDKLNEISKSSSQVPEKMNDVLKKSIISLDEAMHANFKEHCFYEIIKLCDEGNIIDCMYNNKANRQMFSNSCQFYINSSFGHTKSKIATKFHNLTIPEGSLIYKDIYGVIKSVKLPHDIVYNTIIFSKDRKLTIRDMQGYNGYLDNPFVIESGLAKSTIYQNNQAYYQPNKITRFNSDGSINNN